MIIEAGADTFNDTFTGIDLRGKIINMTEIDTEIVGDKGKMDHIKSIGKKITLLRGGLFL